MAHTGASVLILDDDHIFARLAADLVASRGMKPLIAHSISESTRITSERSVDLMLLDLSLPDGTAFDLLDRVDITQHGHIALITGRPSIETAARAVSSPIIEYLIKPVAIDRLEALLDRAAERANLRSGGPSTLGGLIGVSPEMTALGDAIKRVAVTDASVLVSGESGTGKEVVAQALHESSGRPGAFVAVNCGAIAPELLASQLFGHEKGSFTGAHTRHMGFIEQADHGTLFLDEITEMPLAMQVYLLRVLETGKFTRVGALGETAVDVRIVAATNRDPMIAVQNGHLREDLYYRLADVQLQLPPLRKRGRDVVLLAEHFLGRLNERYQGQKRLAPNTERALMSHGWPGNVRELRSAVQRAYLMSIGDLIQVKPDTSMASVIEESETSVVFSIGMTYAEIEERVLRKTLAYLNNDKSATARTLGVSVRTIHNQLARYRIRAEKR